MAGRPEIIPVRLGRRRQLTAAVSGTARLLSKRCQRHEQLARQRRIEAAVEPCRLGGRVDAGKRDVEGGKRPRAALLLDDPLALEVQGWALLAQDVLKRAAAVEGAAHAVQPQEMPLQGGNDRLSVLAAGDAAVAFP